MVSSPPLPWPPSCPQRGYAGMQLHADAGVHFQLCCSVPPMPPPHLLGVCYRVLTEALTVPREMANGGCSSEGCSSGVGRLGAPVTMRKAFMSLLHQAASSPALQHINASCLLPSRWSWSLSVPIPIHKSQNCSPSWVLESLI